MDKEFLLTIANSVLETMPLINKQIFNMNDMAKACPVPPSHIQVIIYLSKRQSSSVSEIASVLGISRPNMTPIIDKLISEEFVERSIDEKDRRVIRVKLTEKAKLFMENHKKMLCNNLTEKLSTLSVEDLEEFEKNLLSIKKIISKL